MNGLLTDDKELEMTLQDAMDEKYRGAAALLGKRSGSLERAAAPSEFRRYSVGKFIVRVVFERCANGWLLGQTSILGGYPSLTWEYTAAVVTDEALIAEPLIDQYRKSKYAVGIPIADQTTAGTGGEIELTGSTAFRRAEGSYFFVPKQAGWERRREEEALGLPINNVFAPRFQSSPPAYGEDAVQNYESGALVLRDGRMFVIKGEDYEIWQGGWSWAGMGLPLGDPHNFNLEVENEPTRRLGSVQAFDAGAIVRLDGWDRAHGVFEGLLFDHTRYDSSYDYEVSAIDVKVVEESGANGWIFGNNKDELRTLFGYEFFNGDQDVTRIEEFNRNTDQGETYTIEKTLYRGGLPLVGLLSIFGIEEDNQTDSRKVLTEFRRSVEESEFTKLALEDLTLDPLGGNFDTNYYYAAMLVGAAVGAAVYASQAVTYTITLVNAAGRVVASKAITGSGAVAGGAYGAVIAAAVVAVANIVALAVAEWEPPDPLMMSSHGLIGPDILAGLSGGDLPSPTSSRFKAFGDYDVRVSSRFERESAAHMIQILDYNVDDGWAKYRLRLRHALR